MIVRLYTTHLVTECCDTHHSNKSLQVPVMKVAKYIYKQMFHY